MNTLWLAARHRIRPAVGLVQAVVIGAAGCDTLDCRAEIAIDALLERRKDEGGRLNLDLDRSRERRPYKKMTFGVIDRLSPQDLHESTRKDKLRGEPMIQKANHRVEDQKNVDGRKRAPGVAQACHHIGLSFDYCTKEAEGKYREGPEFEGVKPQSGGSLVSRSLEIREKPGRVIHGWRKVQKQKSGRESRKIGPALAPCFSRHPTSYFSPSFADHVPQPKYRLLVAAIGIPLICYLSLEVLVTLFGKIRHALPLIYGSMIWLRTAYRTSSLTE